MRITATGTTYTAKDVLTRLGAYGRAIYFLSPRDSAWNPASTGHEIFGPARVEYVLHQDGGINVHVGDLTSRGPLG